MKKKEKLDKVMSYYLKKSTHVEFVGIAAAGKSSVSKEFISHLQARDYEVITPEERSFEFLKLNKFQRYAYPLWYILKDVKAIMALLVFFMYFLQLRPFNRLERREYFLIISSYIFKNFFTKRSKNGIFVFGGEIAMLPGLNLDRLDNRDLIRLLDSLFIHDVHRAIVFVNTPIDIAIERAHNDSTLADFRPEAFVEDVNKRQKIYQRRVGNQDRLIKVLKKRGKDFRVIEIDGTKSVGKNAERIIDIMEKEFFAE